MEGEYGKAVCETESGARLDAMRDTDEGDGEGERGSDASEVDLSGYAEAPVDGTVGKNI